MIENSRAATRVLGLPDGMSGGVTGRSPRARSERALEESYVLGGEECLLRASSGVFVYGGGIGPETFIPLAEETGLSSISWATCRSGRPAPGRAAPKRAAPTAAPLVMSLHLSGRQFEEPELVSRIAAVIEAEGIRPDQLHFEGIETEEQRGAVTEPGCEHGQGLLFSPPLPADDIQTYLEELSGVGSEGRR